MRDDALSCIFNTHLIGVYADFYGDFSSLKPNGEVEEPIKNCNLNFFHTKCLDYCITTMLNR